MGWHCIEEKSACRASAMQLQVHMTFLNSLDSFCTSGITRTFFFPYYSVVGRCYIGLVYCCACRSGNDVPADQEQN